MSSLLICAALQYISIEIKYINSLFILQADIIIVRLLYNNTMRESKQVNKIKMFLLGSAKTGKTTFLEAILSSSPNKPSHKRMQSKQQLNDKKTQSQAQKKTFKKPSFNQSLNLGQGSKGEGEKSLLAYTNITYNKKLLENNYQLQISKIRGDIKVDGEDYDKTIDKYLFKTNLFILFVDVSNNQSFMDLARVWYPYARKANPNAAFVLLANKVDRGFGVGYKNIYDFCSMNGLWLFCNSIQLQPKRIFDEIILYYQSQTILKQIRESYETEQKKTSNTNIFKKVFKFNINIDQKNTQIFYKNKLKKIEQSYTIRYQELKKVCSSLVLNVYADVQRQLIKILRLSTRWGDGFVEGNDFAGFVRKFEDKMKQQQKLINDYQHKQLNSYQKILQLQQKSDNLSKLCQQNQKKLSQKTKQSQTLNKSLQQLKNKRTQQSQKNKQQKQQLENIINKLKKQMQMIRHNQNTSSLKSIVGEYQLAQAMVKANEKIGMLELKCKKTQDQLGKIRGKLEERAVRQGFWDGRLFREVSIHVLSGLRNSIEKYMGKSIKQCIKIYELDLCWNTNFHSLIDSQPNLLFIIQLKLSKLLIFTPQPLTPNRKGKHAKFYLIKPSQNNEQDEPTSTLYQLQTVKETQMWRYDPIYLIFGKQEMNIKFGKNECSLMLVEKKKDRLFLKEDKIVDVLGLEEKGEGEKLVYLVDRFEVLRVEFV